MRVVELAGLAPAPFAGMLLADMGAEVLRVDRVGGGGGAPGLLSTLERSKRRVGIDLKQAAGVEALLRLVDRADALIEGFRPGVAERLGFGPDVCLARRPPLVYGRVTGWGQEGPWSQMAGHDIDYIALAGALDPLGRAGGPPTPPINVLGDFAGGGMLLAFGVVCAALEARSSGRGQVVDAAMVDGAALMLAPFYTATAAGIWGRRGTNLLDTGAHFYDVYETADGGWMAVGAIEPRFYGALLHGLGLAPDDLPAQLDSGRWPEAKRRLAEVFRTRTRDEWSAVFEGTDACVAPVLGPLEAPAHPHNVAREAFVDVDGLPQPAPAPRFSRTSPPVPRAPGAAEPPAAVLGDWGFSEADVAELEALGALG
jgi:alpha-methylacyl-CoA racemase